MDKAQAPGDVISQGPPGEPPPPPSGRPRDEDRLTRKPLTFWDRIKFLLLLVLLWFVLVWSAMANDPLVGFSDAMRIEVARGLVGVPPARPRGAPAAPLLHQRALGRLPPVLDREGVRRVRAGHPPADLRLVQVPHLADGDLGGVDRDHRHRDRQDHPHHADPGPAPRPSAALARAAVRAAGCLYALVRRAPVRRPLLVHVPRRGGRVLPRRHQDQVLRRLGPGPRARAGQGEHHLP